MADEKKYEVVLTMTITEAGAPFSDVTAAYHDCSRTIMHSIESKISEALVELGDTGLVMLGGDEAAAMLEVQKAAKDKVRGQGKDKDKADDKFAR